MVILSGNGQRVMGFEIKDATGFYFLETQCFKIRIGGMNMIGRVFVGGAPKQFKIFGYSQAPTISAKIADWGKPGSIHFHPPYTP